MSNQMKTFNMPNVSMHDGPDRNKFVPFAASQVFKRYGGKAVDLHTYYQAATAASSNLAGFAQVEEVGTANGRPTSLSAGDQLPVNFALEATCVFPTTGGTATSNDIGKDYDIAVVGNVQYCNLGASSTGVLRISKIVDEGGNYVSCSIPPDLRYGNL